MLNTFSNTRSEAVFCLCGKFRYWLCREWGVHAPFGVFLLQNPSKADALKIDLTTFACSNLALAWGWRGFGIVNVSPYISQNSKKALLYKNDVLNDYWIVKAHKLADYFVIATGKDYHGDMQTTIGRTNLISSTYHCIDRNVGGGYRHPVWARDVKKYPAPKLIGPIP